MKKFALVLACFLCGLLLFSGVVYSQIPRLLSYQGILTDKAGDPVPDGTYTIVVRLYDVAVGGGVLFEETLAVQSVGGTFNAILGKINPLSVPFDKPYFLGITLQGQPEFVPRTTLIAVPYALQAESALLSGGLKPGATGAVTSLNGAAGDLQLNGSGAITITRAGNVLTVNSTPPAAITSVNAADNSIIVTNPNGPATTLSVGNIGLSNLTASGAAAGDIAKFDGTAWKPAKETAYTAGAGIAISGQSIALAPQNATSGQVLKWNGTAWTPANDDNTSYTAGAGLQLTTTQFSVLPTGGDLSGAHTNATVTGILGRSIAPTTLANGQALVYNQPANTWVPSNIDANAADDLVNGANAGGDLTGTYPNPSVADGAITVAKIGTGAVTMDKIGDGQVTAAKINPFGAANGQTLLFNGTSVVWGAPAISGAASGDLTGNYPNPSVAPNAITTAKILDANVTTAKLADASVLTAKLADGAVTPQKISQTGASAGQALTFNGTSVVWGAPAISGAASGDLTGNYPNPSVAPNAITTAKILDANVTTAKLADASVTTQKISQTGATSGQALTFNGTSVVWGAPAISGAASGDLTGNYPNPSVAPNAITTPKILDANVTTAKLADGAVITAKLADGAVTTQKISQTGATVGQALTFNGTSVVWGAPAISGAASGDLTGNYPNPSVAPNAITTPKILDANVTTAKLADGAVITAKLADGAVTTQKISQTGATVGQALTFNGTNVVWGAPAISGAASGDLTGNYPNPSVAPNAITTAKILDANVTTSKLADASVLTAKLADGAVTTQKISQTGATVGQALTFNGTNVVWGAPAISGAASGDLTGNYPNPLVAPNAITTTKILDANVTTSKLADASVITAKLADGAVTTQKISQTGASAGQALTFNGTSIVWGAPAISGAASGDLTGNYPNPSVAPNAITTTKILDANVTTAKLADGAVTTQKISQTGATSGQALTFNGTNVVWGAPAISGAASGDLTGNYPNPSVAPSAITTAKILDANVTTAKLADANVTTAKLADGAVTTQKISQTGATVGQALTFNGTNVVWGAPAISGAASGDLTGNYPNPSVAPNAITTAKILDANVTTAKLADGAVTTQKISQTGATSGQALTFNGTNVVWGAPAISGAASGDLTGNYPNPSVAPNAITTTKILDANVTTSKLADASVITAKLADGAVTTQKISQTGASAGQALTFNGTSIVWGAPAISGAASGDLTGNYPNPSVAPNAITTAKILDANVTTAKLADGAVTMQKISQTGATSGQALTFNGTNVVWGAPAISGAASGDLTGNYPNPSVAPNAITTTKILDANVTTAKLADGAVTTQKISQTGATSGQALTFNGTNVVWGAPAISGAASGDLTGNYPNPSVAPNAITTAKILDANVTTAKLADASVITAKLADGAVTTTKISQTGATVGQALTFNGTNVVWGAPAISGAASGDLTGNYPNPLVAPNAITTTKILDANVTTSKLADASVITAKLADGAVTTTKISQTGATSGQALTFNGTNVVWGAPAISGAASGDLTGNYPNPLVAPNAITTTKILDANVTTSKLADASVITAKLADGAVTTQKISQTGATSGQALTFNGTNVVWGAPAISGAASGDLTGNYPNPSVAPNAITTAKILDANVTTAKLADGAVTTQKISQTGATSGQALTFNGTNVVWGAPAISGAASGDLTGNYPNPSVAPNAITTAKILDANVTTAKLADASVITAKLADGAVTTTKISQTGATVGQALTFNGTNVVWGAPAISGAASGDLTGNYPNPSVAPNAITTAKILDANVTTAKLADASVITAKLADGAVTTQKISQTGATSGQALTFNGTSVVWGAPAISGAASGDLTGNYPNPSVAPNAITTTKILDANVTTSKLADASVITAKLADGAVTTQKISQTGATSGQALTFNGTNVVWGAPAISGAASGDLTGNYPNPSVAPNAITTAKILDANVTTAKLADASVITAKLADGAVTTQKISQTGATSGQALTFNGTNVVWGAPAISGAASGDLTGNYPNPSVAANAITTAKILDANVTTAKLADGSVSTAKISQTGATSGQALTFDGTNVVWGAPALSGTAGGDLTGTYPNPTVAANAITTAKILDANVTTAKLADGSVSTAKISQIGATSGQALTFNGTSVVWGALALSGTAGGDLTGTYPNPTVAANAITTAKLLDANVTTAKLADGAITTAKLADGSVSTAKISQTGATSGQALTFDGTNVVWGAPALSGTAGGDLTGTYPNPTVAANAITTAKLLDANVTTAKLADGAITTAKLADGSVSTAKISQTGATSGQALTFDGTNVVWGAPALSGAAGGDLTGTYPNPTIAQKSATSGQVLKWNGTAWNPANDITGLVNFTESVNTTAPNATVPVVQLLATNAATDVDVALSPKGVGALTAQVANNTAAGGNKRGQYAVDWQMFRTTAAQVASGSSSTVSGGSRNAASGSYSTVSGGSNNEATGLTSTVSGGIYNTADNINATVSGGQFNKATGVGATISGGVNHVASADYATVSGGANNTASSGYATASGGQFSVASNGYSTVAGGFTNVASGFAATISGGYINTASSGYSTISGGLSNSTAGDYSAIAGGRGLTLTANADNTFGFLANGGGLDMTIDAANTAVFGNTNLWLANNNNTPRELRFYEANAATGAFPPAGVNYTAFKAGAQSADITYTLPIADGTSGQVLSTNGSGTLSWATAAGGLTHFTESVNTAAPNTTVPVVRLLANNAAANVDVALSPKGTGALTAQVADNTTIGGNKRGTRAVDWQMERGNAAHVASGPNSTIGGGKFNTAGGTESTVAGGNSGNASGTQSFIGGGVANTASNLQAVVSGGFANTASGDKATVGGGQNSTASGSTSSIGGGQQNTASGTGSSIAGGLQNAAGGNSSAIAGGQENLASGGHSAVGGGYQNTTSGFFAAIPGGRGLTLGANRTFGFHGNTSAGDRNMSISDVNTAVFGNVDLWLASNDNSPRAIRFYEQYNTAGAFPNGTNYVGFKAPNAIAADVTWTLPAADGTSGQVLTTSGSGVLNWTSVSGGDVVGPASAAANAIARYNSTTGKIIQNSGIVIDDYTTATQNNVRLRADDGATANITLVLSPKGTGALTAQKPDGATTGGSARGQYAVDWQMSRTVNSQVASGNYATIGGGANNAAPDAYTTVAGGSNNKIISGSNVAYATIGGGGGNTIGNGSIPADYSTIAGGNNNSITSWRATIGGGTSNQISASSSTIGGGNSNTASGGGATIGGGNSNTASGGGATIGGGGSNTASGGNATIGGGVNNIASVVYGTVGGGISNTASGSYASTVAGGNANTASGQESFVGGGFSNTAGALYSTIPGGRGLTLSSSAGQSFGFLANTGSNDMTISASNTAVFGNANLWLANNTNAASELRFYEPNSTTPGAFPPAGVNYTAFKAGAQTADVTYTLPTADGTSGQALTTNGSGALSWASPSISGAASGDLTGNYPNPTIAQKSAVNGQVLKWDGSAWNPANDASGLVNFTESINFTAPNTTVPVVQLLATNAATDIDVALSPKGNGALTAQVADNGTSGGNKRGTNAVDWQKIRNNANQVASGSSAVIGGGERNKATAANSTVGGGQDNTASNSGSTVAGGLFNTASGLTSAIGGGWLNSASSYSAIPGGIGLVLGQRSFGYHANRDNSGTNDRPMAVSATNTAVFGNVDLWLANNDNSPRSLRFYEQYDVANAFPNGTNYVGFKAPNAIAADVTWTLPAADGTNGQVLSTNGSGTLSWATAAGGLTHFTESVNTAAPNATVPVVRLLATNSGATNVDIALSPKGTGALTAQVADNTTTGGNKRGTRAVDWQMERGNAAHVASGPNSTIGGGKFNTAGGTESTVAGGNSANASGTQSFIGGGVANTASNLQSVVSGGFVNNASGDKATIGGGNQNTASGTESTVAGGNTGNASGTQSFIGGGVANAASNLQAVVSGGFGNTASGDKSTIGGGQGNIASGGHSSIGGGLQNTATGFFTAIPGGRGLTLGADRSFGFHANTGGGDRNMSISAANTAVFGNADLWLASNDNSPRAIRFYEQYNTAGAFPNGTNYVGFKAPNAIAADVTWTLPAADGTSGQVLTTNGSGTLSWATTAGGLTHFTESVNTAAPNTTVPVVRLLATNAAANVDVALSPKGTGSLTAQVADNTATGGNKRGIYAVDWQMSRSAATQVASGSQSTVSGGIQNTASGGYATVGGGSGNIASGAYSVVAGGGKADPIYGNTASGTNSTVSGGELNLASASYATVSGGRDNIASGDYATVGGRLNTASGVHAAVSGGRYNTASGENSAIPGGKGLTLSGAGSIGFLGNIDNANANNMSVSAASTAVFGNTNMWLANNTNAASELRFYEANSTASGAFPPTGVNYTAFKAGAQSADITYTLPIADGTNGQVLSTNGSGTLSWATAAGGLTHFTESVNTAAPNATVPVVRLLATNSGATDVDVALSPKGTGALTAQVADNSATGGNKRGIYAVDWQMLRSAANQVASGVASTVGGGGNNTASADASTVSGGGINTASGAYSTISGGYQNTASGLVSTVSGGFNNTASGASTTVGGGSDNAAAGDHSVIPGGRGLTLDATADQSFGFLANTGSNNMTISAPNTAVFGNANLWLANNNNTPSELRFYEAYNTTGAFPNTANYTAFKAGTQTADITYTLPAADGTSGQVLTTNGSGVLSWATAGGGLTNFTESVNTAAPNATVPVVRLLATNSGATNVDIALSPKGTGALTAQVADNAATGGNKRGTFAVDWQMARTAASQVASNVYSTVSGGNNNTASGSTSTVSGGFQNTASGTVSTVSGGSTNTASGSASIVGGGFGNTAAGDYSVIPGGNGLTLDATADQSFGFLANTGPNNMTISAPNTAVFGNANLWLANNNNTPSELRFYEAYNTTGAFPNTANYTAFQAGTQTADITYTLPVTAPTNGQVLSSTAGGVLSWVNQGGGSLANFTESVNNAAPNTTVPVVRLLATNSGATDVDIALSPKGTGALTAQVADNATTGGNKRGTNAVDWQMTRNAFTQVASGLNSVVSGGDRNTSSNNYTTVGGGQQNTANANSSTVGGGFNNQATNQASTVSGGNSNVASGSEAVVSGGFVNTASGLYSTISGGFANTSSGQLTAIMGGRGLNLSGSGSVGFLGNNNGGTNNMTVSSTNTAVFGNTDLWLASNDNAPKAIRFYEQYNTAGAFPNGTNYVGFKAPNAIAADVTWTLPAADGTSGQVLTTNGSGTLSWATAAGGLTHFTESVNAAAPNTTVPVVRLLATNGAADVDIALTPKGNGALTAEVADNAATGGNKRGINAVDWQMARTAANQVASGDISTVSGGQGNIASGPYSTVSGGANNTASGSLSTVSGGISNTAAGDGSVIPGGWGLTLGATADQSFGFLANTGPNNMTISAPNTAVFGNANLWLANNNNTPSELRFYEAYNTTGAFPNTANYTAFKAGTQTADITYTLPVTAGLLHAILDKIIFARNIEVADEFIRMFSIGQGSAPRSRQES